MLIYSNTFNKIYIKSKNNKNKVFLDLNSNKDIKIKNTMNKLNDIDKKRFKQFLFYNDII